MPSVFCNLSNWTHEARPAPVHVELYSQWGRRSSCPTLLARGIFHFLGGISILLNFFQHVQEPLYVCCLRIYPSSRTPLTQGALRLDHIQAIVCNAKSLQTTKTPQQWQLLQRNSRYDCLRSTLYMQSNLS